MMVESKDWHWIEEKKEKENKIWWSTRDNAYKIMASLFISENVYGMFIK